MLFERRKLGNSNSNNSSNSHESANSAGATARKCSSEKKLRSSCYCEENVWRLAYRRLKGSLTESDKSNSGKENEEYYAVFISNEGRCCPMLNQLASDHPMKPCFWDYHVILIQSSKMVKRGRSVVHADVLDMDSYLPYPCALKDYLDGTFKINYSDEDEQKCYAPMFRVVRAENYLRHFYSDRMHMRKEDGSWMAEPPAYDCITTSNMKKNKRGYLSNLDDYIAVSNDKSSKEKCTSLLGDVYTLEQLRSKFCLPE
jgi:hypothetical protein